MANPRSKLLCTVRNLLALGIMLLVVPGGSALAQEWTLEKDQLAEKPKPYSPYVDQYFPQRVFFGDPHTSLDGIRCQTPRNRDARGGHHDRHRSRLYKSDLVRAAWRIGRAMHLKWHLYLRDMDEHAK